MNIYMIHSQSQHKKKYNKYNNSNNNSEIIPLLCCVA
jgi:hypothetical protein